MKRSRFLLNTQKEIPKEAVVASHVLMLRTGMVKPLTSGIYSYMPLALRVLRKIENILRQELDVAGCQELLMPVVQPGDLWVESGRWRAYGKELLRFKDRKDNDYCLGPTHEEVITDIVRQEVKSYKNLPLNLYQIQTKFRDEIRPRFGLMRGREFTMKDAYSFDVDDEASTVSYQTMFEAYRRIFTRCGLNFRPVEADPGAIGGTLTHEFHVLAKSGEDLILSCTNCDYAANVERCEVVTEDAFQPESGDQTEPVLVETPGQKSIESLCKFLGVKAHQCIKTLLYRADDQLVGVAVTGDRELNETALKNAFDAIEVNMVTDAETFLEHGLHPGYLGPVGWPESIPLYADPAVMALSQAVAGANRKDFHHTGVVPVRHLSGAKVLNLRLARAGDTCPRCGEGSFEAHRGIEVGHIFKLGCKYSHAMKATYLDVEGKEQPLVMGCYGIGVGRTMAAAIEQNFDKDGICWPVQIAPFQVMLLNLDPRDDHTNQAVETLYDGLKRKGVEVLVDDTAARPGSKFKDADLIGLPLQVTVGARSLNNGIVELKRRASGERSSVVVGEAVEGILRELKALGWESTRGTV